MKKTININAYILQYTLISTFSSVAFFFILNNFGNFSVLYYGGEQPHKTPAEEIYYTTPLGTQVETEGNGYSYTDVLMEGEIFQEDYSVKFPYVLKTIYKDLPYIIILSTVIFLLLIFRKRYKFRFNQESEPVANDSPNPTENITENSKDNNEYNQIISYLKELNEEGILTDLELESKIQKIEKERKDSFKESLDYSRLKELNEKGYLTDEEFEQKVQMILSKASNGDK